MKDLIHRREINFDRDWYFHNGDIDIRHAVKAGMGDLTDCQTMEEGEWLQIAFADKTKHSIPDDWELVNLPHDWLLDQLHDKDADWERGFKKSGIGCYRKLFDIPASDAGRKVTVQFDGIMRNSTVWVNGHLLGTHPSGSVPFYYDITDVVRYGDEGNNVIFVRVDARDYEGWWYDGAGIYRHVRLMVTDRLHVGQWGTFVMTPSVTKEAAALQIETTIHNEYPDAKRCELLTEIVNTEGRIVASAGSRGEIEADGESHFVQQVEVKAPSLWSVDTPNLYRAITTIKADGSAVDRYETEFGIRTIEFTSDRGFFLNGERTVIKGLCVHQDFAGVGVALPDGVIAYKLKLLKEMGANAYRSAHHPPTRELLEMCDRMGILVIDENRKLDSSPEGLKNLKHMVCRDRNHPSVIAWSLENEEVLEGTVMGARILETMARTVRKLDPSRPLTAALNHGFNEAGYSDVLDVVGYNYGHREGGIDAKHHEEHPERKMYGSEVAAYCVTRGVYEDEPTKGYCSEYGTSQRDIPWLTGWTTTPMRAWGDVMKHSFLAGMFIWSGFDYRGEPSPYRWPVINSHFGTMDTCGFPKHNYYYYKSAWTEEPMVHLLPHWNWPGKEGQELDVLAYGNCETVELFLNGRSLGEKRRPPNGYFEWRASYEPGELRAVGKRGGLECAVATVTTTGPAHHIRLEPDRNILLADGTNVAMIRVSICDEAGSVVPIADNEVRFSVDGNISILGVGNGDPISHEPDKADRRRAFNGYCLVIVQAGTVKGKAVLRASSVGLLNAETVLSLA